MNFSVNQFRHLFVATAKGAVLAADGATGHKGNFASDTATGTIDVKADAAKTHVYFPYMGAGGQVRSDLIKTSNILYAKATDASKMVILPNTALITGAEDSGQVTLVPGQDYIVKINYRQYIGLSEESTYFEYGEVHVTKNMTQTQFWSQLAKSLYVNTRKQGMVDIYAVDEGLTKITDTYDFSNFEWQGLMIVAKEQDWNRGTKAFVLPNFEVTCSTINDEGDEVIPFLIYNNYLNNSMESIDELIEAGLPIYNNGRTIADLEYFCMGERGDIYRGVSWPNVIPTQYLVNPTLPYHTFDIHYAYVGDNESVQKSEKTLTIVASDKAVLNSIITAFNTATGMSVATL